MNNASLYSEKMSEALQFAATLHRTQVRKSTAIPYLSHLMAVCAFVMEDGGDEVESIAALLHDAVEDQGGLETLEAIRERFSERVADIVHACSDTTEHPKPPWHDRKRLYIQRLETVDEGTLRVVAADKLHNVMTTVEDLREVGETVWDPFNVDPEDFGWCHSAVLEVLERRLPGSRNVDRLRAALSELESLRKSDRRKE